jgi:hypothetical protein
MPLTEFNNSIFKHLSIEAMTDMIPNLQNPKNPLPYDPMQLPPTCATKPSRMTKWICLDWCAPRHRGARSS